MASLRSGRDNGIPRVGRFGYAFRGHPVPQVPARGTPAESRFPAAKFGSKAREASPASSQAAGSPSPTIRPPTLLLGSALAADPRHPDTAVCVAARSGPRSLPLPRRGWVRGESGTAGSGGKGELPAAGRSRGAAPSLQHPMAERRWGEGRRETVPGGTATGETCATSGTR